LGACAPPLKIGLALSDAGSTTEFRLLGPIAALADGRALALGAPKQRALLATLLLQPGEVVSRDRLVDSVWGEDPPASAQQSLQVYVHGLRRALGAERIETHGAGYRLRVHEGELDLQRFDRLAARGRAALDAGRAAEALDTLESALALWSGSPLADLADEPIGRREIPRLEDARLHAIELRNDAQLAVGASDELVGGLNALIAEHPYRERLHAQLVLALYRAGRQKDALDAYRAAQRTLVDELGIDPGPELQSLEQRILNQDETLLSAPQAATVVSLPSPSTPLLGRHLEVVAVDALLGREDVRLVTLTGPGGSGKTRLALAAAAELARVPSQEVVFVDLSAIRDAALLPSEIARRLEVEEEDGSIEDEVVHNVRPRRLLLVLDNLEQLLPDVTYLSRLLADAPGVRILATSRAPLRLGGEHEYPVPSLQLADAVELFVARAAAVDPSFTSEDGIEEICVRLDGLPLAIELAAAQTRIMSVEQIVERLGGVLDLLTGGARDLPERQQTLRATLDWSYELTEPAERALLGRLAVFAGSFDGAAAEAVGGNLGTVAALVEKNLVRRREDGRFALLETIREYALAQLDAAEVEAARREQALHFLELAERVGLETPEQLVEDLENVRAALDWSAARGEIEIEVRLAVALRQFWVIRGGLNEARRRYGDVIARSATADPVLHARALVHGAIFPYRQGAFAEARAQWQEALAIFRSVNDTAEVGRCLAELASVEIVDGDLDRAIELYEEAVDIFRASGQDNRLAMCLANLGAIASMKGDLEGSAAYTEQGIALQRAHVDRDGLGISLHNLARTRLQLGEVDEARRLFAESAAIAEDMGYRELIAYCLGSASELVYAGGETERAAQCLGASARAFEDIGSMPQGDEAEMQAQVALSLAEELGDERFAELQAEGRSLDPHVLLAEAFAP
jgi:predicted ATPase/DNA-binding SARP family transcriptional activator